MEENKYYTPDISEFHVGFNYEVNYGNNEWVKESIYAKPQVVTLPYMNLENIRVKFLDRDDILGNGFREDKEFTEDKHRKDNYPNMFSFKKGAKRNGKEVLLSLVAHLDKHIVIIMYADDLSRPAFKTIFDGTIKNINELQTLLKQLNIE